MERGGLAKDREMIVLRPAVILKVDRGTLTGWGAATVAALRGCRVLQVRFLANCFGQSPRG